VFDSFLRGVWGGFDGVVVAGHSYDPLLQTGGGKFKSEIVVNLAVQGVLSKAVFASALSEGNYKKYR
jgi:hypothetical protein